MDVMHEGIRTVSGIHFIEVDDTYDVKTNEDQLIYLIYIDKEGRNREDISSILKFIRMFAWLYRICLLDIDGKNEVGFLIYCDENERDEMTSMMEWIAKTHTGWTVIEYTGDNLRIIGIRIANNMFHEKKLILQGEILD